VKILQKKVLMSYDDDKKKFEAFRLVPFLTGDSGGNKRQETVTLGKKAHGERRPNVLSV
jgi:hypothetical protein